MKAKKLLAMLLAGATIASMAMPTFAKSTKITANYQAVTIDVLVPSTGKAYINPYALPISVPDPSDASKSVGEISEQQITTMPLYIVNMSKIKLDVDATMTVKPTNVTVLKTAPDNKASEDEQKAKWITVALEAKTTDLTKSAITTKDGVSTVDMTQLTNWVKDKAKWDGAGSLEFDPEKEDGCKEEAIVTLEKATEATSGSGSSATKVIEVATGGIAAFRLTGDVCEEPATAWTAKDGIEVNIAFTFKPNTTT